MQTVMSTLQNSVKYAKSAYTDSKNIISSHYGCQVRVDITQEYCVVSFRGSEQILDWLCNLLASRASFHGTNVHRGFLIQYNSVRSELLEVIKNKRNILCCGHSLGGALAALCAIDIWSLGFDITLITIGAPRVGDAAFNRKLSRIQSYHIQNKLDPVTYMPPCFHRMAPSIFVKSRHLLVNHHSLNVYDQALSHMKSGFRW